MQLKHEKSFSAQNLKIKLDLVNGQAYCPSMNAAEFLFCLVFAAVLVIMTIMGLDAPM